MQVEVVLGLPYLSSGALTATARKLGASVLLSASAFCRYEDFGPVPDRWLAPEQRGGRTRRMREWSGWNLSQLRHADGLSIDLDSAGFVAMALNNGFQWSPEAYVHGLCAAHPWRRFSSMDMCVEPEVARDRDEVRERVAKTIALNRECRLLANDAGIEDRLMPVIQGATADDYLSCFDAMSSSIRPGDVIGVGSMCRRPTRGEDGIVAIVDRLDRELPKGVRLHLFGVKSDGAEAVAMLAHRVASIDSQAFGVRARRLANDERARDPSFSKTNAFVATVMENWWTTQNVRMARAKGAVLQTSLPMPAATEPAPRTVFDALVLRSRAETNELIMSGDLAPDEAVTHHDIEGDVQMMIEDLPDDVSATDAYVGLHQLPERARENWPIHVDPVWLHPSIRPAPEPADPTPSSPIPHARCAA